MLKGNQASIPFVFLSRADTGVLSVHNDAGYPWGLPGPAGNQVRQIGWGHGLHRERATGQDVNLSNIQTELYLCCVYVPFSILVYLTELLCLPISIFAPLDVHFSWGPWLPCVLTEHQSWGTGAQSGCSRHGHHLRLWLGEWAESSNWLDQES